MRDWVALVRERLGGLGLTPTQEKEIVAELAAHLEDLYQQRLEQGLCEPEAAEAVGRALDEVAGWRRLARKIRRAKHEEENMNDRTKHFWLPGLVSVAAASLFGMILTQVSLETPRSRLTLNFYLVWVAAQPLFGAMGAYFSRRGGGQRLARLAASLFPSIATLVTLAVVFVVALTHSLIYVRRPPAPINLVGFAKAIFFFATAIFFAVVVPGVALLLGALPFLKSPKAGVFAKS